MDSERWIHVAFENGEHKEFRVRNIYPTHVNEFDQYDGYNGGQITINMSKVHYVNNFFVDAKGDILE